MALHPPQGDKLIFAPGGNGNDTQAAQFTLGTLSRADLDSSSPIPQFHAWFSAAQDATLKLSSSSSGGGVAPAETCTLSTAELPSGRVSSRMVYLKELDARGGFVVYSNLGTSRKASDLATNPHAALCFHWPALQRQVRVEGGAARVPRGESQAYFDTRARGSRIGAWSSRQSAVLEPTTGGDDGRAQLEGWVGETERRFEGREDIPVPEFWGGLRIVPTRVEFWQGRDSRLHDRFVYEREREDGEWTLNRLSP
ncbi:pyridoxamine 5'-phosphate oxidase [Cordyceps fumosorosea ARSEF 2679]|uniref:pyridoxal 5'-phosphate synthase n=1 Tax=Cordyceps fumosorosea (strain ARSEF 2679) TaxID=1081104 RepID=A0A167U8Z7_CORFA|nr:pyridoxamine 5'-phosphate oxidase [Cordyceps fumosorosea ARSEF 2679]OAA61346.1 pyridoxamine 5'-phosphate oxidase [Cordyceps fumosorosea ARSEF 2679]